MTSIRGIQSIRIIPEAAQTVAADAPPAHQPMVAMRVAVTRAGSY